MKKQTHRSSYHSPPLKGLLTIQEEDQSVIPDPTPMVGPSLNNPKPPTVKFLCSYGGKILPRYPDGKLRYHGGETRVLAVHRFVSFSELMVKIGELCGAPVSLRCQLPTEDLDALVSVTSDEDLVNLMEEYDRVLTLQSSSPKIRAFLSLPKKSSPTPSTASASVSTSSTTTSTATLEAASPRSPLFSASYSASRSPVSVKNRCIHQISKSPEKPLYWYNTSAGKLPYYACRNSNRSFLVHGGNHWQ